MPRFILLSTLTDKGLETIAENPTRITEVNKEVEGMGAKIVDQYALLGPYDFLTIIEAPDNETVARISVKLGERGTVKIMSLPAIPTESFIKSLQK
ncbi:MAG TPA: GYD domain-containing protein [Candidatus Caldiarchaeum subterraneum]|uniref:GYD domain-containing protein n=1 Tax=Caldiarchaeum subterraneum TaxID=311458 RepID=A0A832ZVI9_CALS0|nr:GYD domain-containing protein [Aigarchaeota archaeon]HIQ29428.1 GYD domain-containing protein [Candidatus Caldarchaeum subterraneum]